MASPTEKQNKKRESRYITRISYLLKLKLAKFTKVCSRAHNSVRPVRGSMRGILETGAHHDPANGGDIAQTDARLGRILETRRFWQLPLEKPSIIRDKCLWRRAGRAEQILLYQGRRQSGKGELWLYILIRWVLNVLFSPQKNHIIAHK